MTELNQSVCPFQIGRYQIITWSKSHCNLLSFQNEQKVYLVPIKHGRCSSSRLLFIGLKVPVLFSPPVFAYQLLSYLSRRNTTENPPTPDEITSAEHIRKHSGGACGVTVIVVGNGYGEPSPNPGQGCLHFT